MESEKSPSSQFDVFSIPKPKTRNAASLRLVAVAVLALLLVGGAAAWLTSDDGTRKAVTDGVTTVIEDATKGTPLASVGSKLLGTSPPPPDVSTKPGTLGGKDIHGSVGAPVDLSAPASRQDQLQNIVVPAQSSATAAQQPQTPTTTVSSDATVRPDFIEDLAAYVVSKYRAGPRDGTFHLSVQSVNQRYGTNLTGLTGPSASDRASLLRYVFNPSMIQGLYSIYADRFLQAVDSEVAARNMPPEAAGHIRRALAGRCVTLAAGLEAITVTPEMGAHLRELEHASQDVVDVSTKMTMAVFNLDQLRDNDAAEAKINAAQKEVDNLGKQYRTALDKRASAQRSLVIALRKRIPTALDDDTLIFLAHWVSRRQKEQSPAAAISAVKAAAAVLRDLSFRCTQSRHGAATGQ